MHPPDDETFKLQISKIIYKYSKTWLSKNMDKEIKNIKRRIKRIKIIKS
jgi:hypothetical protein